MTVKQGYEPDATDWEAWHVAQIAATLYSGLFEQGYVLNDGDLTEVVRDAMRLLKESRQQLAEETK